MRPSRPSQGRGGPYFLVAKSWVLRRGDDPVEDGHESGGAEEEANGGGRDSCGGDLGGGEVGFFGDGGGDEGGGEVEVGNQGYGEDDGDVGAEVAHGATELRPDGGLEVEVGGEAVVPPLTLEERGENCVGGEHFLARYISVTYILERILLSDSVMRPRSCELSCLSKTLMRIKFCVHGHKEHQPAL
ncbi:sulfate transmembrane transporter [Actinidia rufa]|uniref:Sulfate transmembrane transporter n=1 Tax=Actinidia rufa TaxID=165716 RepID=A0A7J0FVE9_9ERIC|nr:sulfate transmembrane transporter [Actinidia rufa]